MDKLKRAHGRVDQKAASVAVRTQTYLLTVCPDREPLGKQNNNMAHILLMTR